MYSNIIVCPEASVVAGYIFYIFYLKFSSQPCQAFENIALAVGNITSVSHTRLHSMFHHVPQHLYFWSKKVFVYFLCTHLLYKNEIYFFFQANSFKKIKQTFNPYSYLMYLQNILLERVNDLISLIYSNHRWNKSLICKSELKIKCLINRFSS